jgi:hypothetical protein
MPMIDGIAYPDTLGEMVKVKDLARVFQAYWPSQTTPDDKKFAQRAASATQKTAHSAFELSGLQAGAPRISISRQDAIAVSQSVEAGYQSLAPKEMLSLVRLMHGMLTSQVKRVALTNFYRSTAFQNFHRKALGNGEPAPAVAKRPPVRTETPCLAGA